MNPDMLAVDGVEELPGCTEGIIVGRDVDKRSCGIVVSVDDAMEDKNGRLEGEAGGDAFGRGTTTLGIAWTFEPDFEKSCPVPRRRVAPTGG